ncbi:MAG: Holliday junction branch migration protein RuvA [Sulfurospirillum sp.]|nr:Holliday junction branch migration protein RuvA [Sulfurospirillum sp.]
MIVGIYGKIIKKEPTLLHVRADSGLVYRIHISLHTSSKVQLGEVFLHTTQIIREDMHSLYGFFDTGEKILFDTLIKLNGIGPSSALATCSTLTPQEFAAALASNDITVFQRVPGIGPKSAKRILVELSDFTLGSDETTQINPSHNDALMALESLGFKKENIKKILSTCKAEETSLLIKEALQKLAK